MDAPELTSLLLSMHSTLRTDIDRARIEIQDQQERKHAEIRAQLAQIIARQDVANGRTTTNERAIQALSLRFKRFSGRSVFLSQAYTKKAKAVLAGLALAALEAIHQALPKIVQLLTHAKAPQ